MKIEIKLRDLIFAGLLIAAVILTWLQIAELRQEIKFSQNFTAIVNQLNQNTADIKTIAQAIQTGQQRNALQKDIK